MSELVQRLLDARKGLRPHPFTRIDLIPSIRPVYAVHEHDLDELLNIIVSGEFRGKTPEKWSERLDSNQRPLTPQESPDA